MKYFSVFVLLFAVFVLFASAEETAEVICRQPKIRGRCRALIPKFHYNVASSECESFGYGGCGGNDNNFSTKEECEAKCTGIKAE